MYAEAEKFRSLGFLGIWRESLNIIFTSSEIFLRLGLTLILPLSFAHFAHLEISHRLFPNIMLDVESNMAYAMNFDTTSYVTALHAFSRHWTTYASIELAFAAICVIFSISSGTVIVRATTHRNVTIKQVVSNVIPRVWGRLVVNLIFMNIITGVCDFIFSFVNSIIVMSPKFRDRDTMYVFLSGTISTSYTVGGYYFSVIWQLVDVVSIVEGDMGLEALKRSMELMKGKMVISLAIYVANKLCLGIGPELYKSIGDEARRLNSGMLSRVGFGLAILLLHCFLLLLQLVVVAVFYLVCKSSRCESVEKSAISDDKVRQDMGYVVTKSNV